MRGNSTKIQAAFKRETSPANMRRDSTLLNIQMLSIQLHSDSAIERINLDAVHFTVNENIIVACVVDGATPTVRPAAKEKNENITAAFAQDISQEIACQLLRHQGLEAFNFAIQAVSGKYAILLSDDSDCVYPSAAGIALVVHRKSISKNVEIYSVGDCLAVLKINEKNVLIDGVSTGYSNSQVKNFARKVHRKYGLSSENAKNISSKYFSRERRLLNQPNGYAVLGRAPLKEGSLRRFTYDSKDLSSVLLGTDGAFNLATDFHECRPEELLDQVLINGAKQTIQQLRNLETAEDSLDRAPRFKSSDDASLLLFDFREEE